MTEVWFETSVIMNSLTYTEGELEISDASPETLDAIVNDVVPVNSADEFIELLRTVQAERQRLTFIV